MGGRRCWNGSGSGCGEHEVSKVVAVVRLRGCRRLLLLALLLPPEARAGSRRGCVGGSRLLRRLRTFWFCPCLFYAGPLHHRTQALAGKRIGLLWVAGMKSPASAFAPAQQTRRSCHLNSQ